MSGRATRVVGASRVRAWRGGTGRLVLLGLAVVGLWVWSLRSGPMPAVAAGDGSPARGVRSTENAGGLIDAAEEAIHAGELEEADRLLGRAIAASAWNERAASAIRALHDHPEFRLGVDEEAVDEVLAQLGPGYRVTETRHFVIVSDCDPTWRLRREALLERTYREVIRFAEQLGAPWHPPATKLLCVMMRDYQAYKAFGLAQDSVRSHWVAGYYAGEKNRIVLYNDQTNPQLRDAEARLEELEARAMAARERARAVGGAQGDAYAEHAASIERVVEQERRRLGLETEARSEGKTIHEAAHLIAFNCGLQLRSRRYPLWLTEGMATGFETDDPDRSFGPDRAFGAREEQFDRILSEGRVEELRRFVTRLRASEEAEKAEAEYAQSYALFRHLTRFHRSQLGALLADIAGEPPGEITPSRHLRLFERRFGPVDRLERRWLRLESR